MKTILGIGGTGLGPPAQPILAMAIADARNSHLGEWSPGRPDGSILVGSRGEVPVGVLGVIQKLK